MMHLFEKDIQKAGIGVVVSVNPEGHVVDEVADHYLYLLFSFFSFIFNLQLLFSSSPSLSNPNLLQLSAVSSLLACASPQSKLTDFSSSSL
ncbi:hypothetical protein LINGRAHAP2_LOCUS12718 [Linum grandiflorum]